ncbi:hypothetical protein [Kitasatospora sp. NPDC051914]|uniref:hypothetical protein n=1 Tax=Kitasatospora sp. NPDC051914 TaxID=3154945 RepID=UPI00343BB79F
MRRTTDGSGSEAVRLADADCATCHGAGSSRLGQPCGPCGVRLTPALARRILAADHHR